ncbi:MAG TPA: RdgB/HAM1 family non-canonical purine NTP pyrophosphatase [Polyangia bacterium]|jgi:XTP/dITP diphosphohydrolase
MTTATDARQTVVVATRNRGKLREILALLEESRLAFRLVTIDELAPDAELREDEDTFEGNALAKARQAAAATGLPALADDSGLEVDALDGAPGVWSARYAGLPSDDARNNEKLVQALRDVPADRRAGRYRCVAAYVDPRRGLELVRAGSCEGELRSTPQGQGGFGYDPYFFLPALGRTMAEIELAEKNQMSHRAAAFRALAAALAASLGSGFPAP